MTDQLKQDAQQALEALETCREDEWHSEDDFGMEQTYDEDKVAKAITALRTTLKQPRQEPVACRFCHDARGCWTWQCYHCGEIDDVQQPAAQPEQRKPLTEEDLRKLADKHLFYQPEGYEVSGIYNLARAIEAAHGIKENT